MLILNIILNFKKYNYCTYICVYDVKAFILVCNLYFDQMFVLDLIIFINNYFQKLIK